VARTGHLNTCACYTHRWDPDRLSTAPLLRVARQIESICSGLSAQGKTNQEQLHTPTYWGAASSKPQSMGIWEDKVGAALRRSPVIHRPSTALQQLILCSGSASTEPPHSTPSAHFSSPFSFFGGTVAALEPFCLGTRIDVRAGVYPQLGPSSSGAVGSCDTTRSTRKP
jgi:hypothetical protein